MACRIYLKSLETDANGTTNVYAQSVKTSGTPGSQTYNDDVVLQSDVTFEGTTVSFNEDLDAATAGQQGATVNAATTNLGNASDDEVGGSQALKSLDGALVRRWRTITRSTFRALFKAGYRLVDYDLPGARKYRDYGSYILEKKKGG